jgi:putative ABC transport system permease protein
MKDYLFELKEGLIISLQAIRANKGRAILTTLGIVIGITAVVCMSTAIKGIDNAFQKGVASMGSDVLYIDKWEWFNRDIPWWELRNRKNLTIEDYKKYKELAKLPVASAPAVSSSQTIKYKDISAESISVEGTSDEYIKTTNLNFSEGRFFNELEGNGGREVAVLGSAVAKTLFPRGDGMDQTIKIKGHPFKVIGVLAEQGSWLMGNSNPDNQVYIPIQNIFKYFQKQDFRSITFNVRAQNSKMVDATKEEAIGIMRRVRSLSYSQKNDFSINQQEALLENIDKTVGVIQIAGLFITGLSLFVGAIGIMNIMFVSVKERTREIGIRKAIGAKKRAILTQFITESAIICLIGGLIGLLFAIILTMIINQYLTTSVQADAFILAIVISIMTGVVSGFAPAYTAAKLDPVEALRYE